MHNADKIEVTRQDALDWMGGAMRNWAHVPRINDDDVEDVRAALQRLAQTAVEAACRDKDAEIEGWRQKWIRSTERCRDMKHERDQLRAKLDEAEAIIHAWREWLRLVNAGDDCEYLNGNAWSDVEELAVKSVAFLASAPQPTPPASEEG